MMKYFGHFSTDINIFYSWNGLPFDFTPIVLYSQFREQNIMQDRKAFGN